MFDTSLIHVNPKDMYLRAVREHIEYTTLVQGKPTGFTYLV